MVSALVLLGILTARVSSRLSGSPELRPTPQGQLVHTRQPRPAQNFGKLPLNFEVNRGQTDSQVKFLSRGSGYALFLTGNEAVLSLKKPSATSRQLSASRRLPVASSLSWPAMNNRPRIMDTLIPPLIQNPKSQIENWQPPTPSAQQSARTTVRLRLVGADPKAKVIGVDELPGKSNYFIGNSPKKWRTNVPTYAKVKYQNLYPGVDLIYYGNQRQLEYDFVVAPGADPNRIGLQFHGAGKPRIDDKGDLVLGADGDEVRLQKPQVYQDASRTRKAVEGRYWMAAANTISFRVGDYDRSKPLVIDPVLVYSTYLGGEEEDVGLGIAVDSAGNAYVTGYTEGDFPTMNSLQPYESVDDCAFVAKIDPSGSALVYSTYLGGSQGNPAYGIAVDSAGNAYVTGSTTSSNFPTMNPLQTYLEGNSNAFVTKINPSGSALVYSTYLGGSEEDVGMGIAVDGAGNAYVTGTTLSTNFPTANPLQDNFGGGYSDTFVAKLNPAGSALVYSTYLGGSGDDSASGIAVDSAGNAYVTGSTTSSNFPTMNPLQPTYGGGNGDVFVAKINPSGSALVYSTYLGGSGGERGSGIAVDSAGNAHVTGSTTSSNFPTMNPLQPTYGGGNGDVFVAKINPSGSALVYSTYLGGSEEDVGEGIAVDSAGNAYVTGYTNSSNFPTMNALQPFAPSGAPAFIAQLNSTGSALGYSTYLGGSQEDLGMGIAVDSAGNAYVTGIAESTNFPTVNALQPTYGGNYDSFVAKISSIDSATITTITAPPITYAADGLVTVSVTSSSGTVKGTVTLSVDGGAPLSQNLSGGSTVFTLADLTGGAHSLSASYAAQGNFLASSATGTLTVNQAASTTLITANTPNPSAPGQAVVVSFQVTGNGTPTGTVTVSASSGEACAGTLSAGTGSCSLTFITVGSRTLTASYAGDVNFAGSSSAGVTQTVNGPLASLSPPSVNFGNVYRGLLGVQTVTLTNIGNASMSISSISISATGSSGGEFSELSLCPSTLRAGRSCYIVLTFIPNGKGYTQQTATLNVTDNALGSPQSVPLGAQPINPQATLSTYLRNFGTEKVGTTSTAKTVTLTNTGATTLTLSTLNLRGNFAFASGTTCVNGGAVAAGESCMINVDFTPETKGINLGSLTIKDNALLSPQIVALSGTGI